MEAILGGATAAVLGLSTEGYGIATRLSSLGVRTYLIDEHLQMGMELDRGLLERFPGVAQLLAEEPLLNMRPLEEVLAEADYVFFAPKVRGSGEEAQGEVSGRLKELASSLKKGSALVMLLPQGPGGNRGNLELIEKVSGLSQGEFDYHYAPIPPGSLKPSFMGSYSKRSSRDKLMGLLRRLGFRRCYGLSTCEDLYMKMIADLYARYALEFETSRRIRERGEAPQGPLGDVYLEEVLDGLYDLRLFASSLDSGDPMLYLLLGIIRSLEAFSKHPVEAVKSIVKRREVKASRTKVICVSSQDRYTMRGERLTILEALGERLRDLVGDVALMEASRLGEGRSLVSEGGMTILLICSKQGVGRLPRERDGLLLLRVNLRCDFLAQ